MQEKKVNYGKDIYMKKLGQLLSVILTISMMLTFVPSVSYAADNVLPVKLEFNADGAFPSGTNGITYSSSGTMAVQDGVLKVTTLGTEEVHGSHPGTHLYYEFTPVESGTLVFEVDYIASTVNAGMVNHLVSMYDRGGNEILRLSANKASASNTYVNGVSDAAYRINNIKWDSAEDNIFGLKFEVDFDNDCWRVYQTKTKTDGVWNWGNALQYKSGDSDFDFMTDAADVSKIRIGLYQKNNEGSFGIDNFKVYKKVTATQSATNYNLLEGETKQAGITFSPAVDAPSDLVWSSSDESVATVDASGLITAKAKGSATINVKSTFYSDINFDYAVNVIDAATGLAFDKTESTICVGDDVTLTLSPVPAGTAYRDLEWSSSNDSIATVEGGVVTGTGKGSATITASATGKNGATISASAVINVIKPLTGLSISASDTSLLVGERATFTAVVTPADASEVAKKWRSANHYIATVDQNGVVTAVGEGTTEIYVSASNFTASQTITVTASKDDSTVRKPSLISFYTPTGYSFYDIDGMEWAQSAVYSAVESGVINPDSETIFGAKRNIKRDEFVSVVIKTLNLSGKKGSAENQEALKNFTDVPESNPYYAEIMKALELGIIQGVSDTQFAPDADITRQDMSVVVCNALKVASVKVEEGRLDFADKDSIAEYAQTSVRILSKMGIIVGKNNNMFDPLANTTRAEVCVIVDRINAKR